MAAAAAVHSPAASVQRRRRVRAVEDHPYAMLGVEPRDAFVEVDDAQAASHWEVTAWSSGPIG